MAHQHINYSNIVLNFRKSEDSVCDVGIPDHCLLYIYSGEITFHEGEKKIVVREGECAFIRRDVRITMHKKSSPKTGYYQSILLKFTRKFLHDFYRKLESDTIPTEIKRSKTSIFKLKITPEVTSLFESIKPFFNSEVEPTEQWLHMKLIEGLYQIGRAHV